MESLTTRLLHVPTLKNRNIQESTKSSAMISTHEREGRSTVVALGSVVVEDVILKE